MEDSIFTKIIKGEIPCHKVYEDEKTIAFLDIQPLNPGHVLVVPKTQIDPVWSADDELYAHLWVVAKKVAGRVKEVLDAPRVGSIIDGYGVPHAHIHVLPLYEGFEHTVTKHVAKDPQEPDHAALAEMAAKLAF